MDITTLSAATPPTASTPTPKTVEQAAHQFESLLIAQMLRSARESSAADDEEGSSEKATMLDLSEQQFAQLLAQKGGLNLSSLITGGLTTDQSRADGAAHAAILPSGSAMEP